jgi:hypothetical protein
MLLLPHIASIFPWLFLGTEVGGGDDKLMEGEMAGKFKLKT